jgi:hypothetical protein
MERRERLLADLQKMQRRVDEFADYGELNMMAEYAQDVKQVQKKIVEVENEIEWINQVSHRKSLFILFDSLLGRNTISNGEN